MKKIYFAGNCSSEVCLFSASLVNPEKSFIPLKYLINTLQNHFCPSLKLKEKHRDGAKYIKKYHSPQTPYQRVINHPDVPDTIKTALKKKHEELNPFAIKAAIEQQLMLIFSLVSVTSNVRHRL